jgi:hypothetical protein
MFPTTNRSNSRSCKCCNHNAILYDVCDFNKSCEEARSKFLPLSGIPIYYYKCSHCGFIFTDEFDAATKEEFEQYIYNDDYIIVDPDYENARPQNNAKMISEMFGRQLAGLTMLDYGGGNGTLARLLSQTEVIQADCYDPFHTTNSARPEQKYKLVTAFEVVEHVPDPLVTFREISSFMDEKESVLLFSTLIQPDNIDTMKTRWWYIGPRNGHISIHSFKSLSLCLASVGLNLASFNQNVHIACKDIPGFARHLFHSK